jgi:dipeptidyl aminopeptidase/acylaminoacyl peptidase
MIRKTLNRRALLAGSGAGAALVAAGTQAQDAKPAAPTSPMPPIEAFARLPFVERIGLSPNATQVAAVTQGSSGKLLVTFNVSDMKPRSFTLGPARVWDVFWADEAHVALTSSTTAVLPQFGDDKQEVTIGLTINVEQGKVWTLFANQLKDENLTATGSLLSKGESYYPIVVNGLTRVRKNGESRIVTSNYRLSDTYDLCLFSFPLESDHGQMIVAGSPDTDGFVVAPDGQVIAFSAFNELRKEWSLAFNTVFGTGKAVFKTVYKTTGEALKHPELIGLGHDGRSVVVRVYTSDKSRANYHEITADGVLGPALNKTEYDTPLFHPVTFCLAGFSRYHEDGVHEGPHYDYTDPLLQKLHEALPKVLGDDNGLIEIRDYADDPRHLLVRYEGDGDAGNYYLIDFTTGNGQQIATDYPGLPAEWITRKTPIEYTAADGLAIRAYLTLPPFKDPKNLPLVVLPHGGPQARDTISFDGQAAALASRGYAVLQPNFRGSSGYGETFVNAGHGEWGRKMQTDLSDGVRHLAKKGLVDPKRVAIFGASYGGYAALAGATLDPGVYTCAVAVAAPSDLKAMVDWEDHRTGYRESSTVLYWKQFMGDPAKWEDISPARQAAKAYCPILLLHGTDDTVVPIEQSQEMARALKAAGKEVTFTTYNGQTHWELDEAARIAMMQAAMDFIQKHNPA